MSLPDDQTRQNSAAAAENIWPPRVAGLRPLTHQEVQELTAALEKPVDRDHLEYWVSTAISNAVKLSSLPSPVQARATLKRFASAGREWIVAEQGMKVQELKVTMVRICQQADSAAMAISRFIRLGGQRSTSPALINFLQNMTGIAKWNGIRPSTPQRAMPSRKPPAFFVFVEKALSTARDLIESSDIPDRQKDRAVRSLQYASRDTLIRILERKRGLISDYHESPHGGLIQDTSRKRKAGPGRARRG